MTVKVYEKQWTQSAGSELVVPSGVTDLYFLLDFPHEFQFNKIMAHNVGGALSGFDIGLYNQLPAGANGVIDITNDSESLTGGGSEPLARVTPGFVAAGSPLVVAQFGSWYFRNVEGTHSVPTKRVFARFFNLAGQTGDSVFELALAGELVTPH